MKRPGLTCAVLASALGYPVLATAQDQVWVKDRRYGEGAGYRAGDLELHAGIAGEFGYDSNYTLAANTAAEPVADTFRLRVTPSISVATLSGQRREAEGGSTAAPKVTFRAGASASYSHFMATSSAVSKTLDDPPISAAGNMALTILPQNPVSVDLLADFARSIQPSTNLDLNFDRIGARFGAGITWTPGGGMFDWRLGYEYGLTTFEDPGTPDQPSPKLLSNHYHQINTRGRWRFLPRTALLYDATATFVRYNSDDPALLSSDPIRARIGINGLVTSSFALLAMVGWGSSFYQGPFAQQFDGPIAQAELKWFLTPNPSSDPLAAALTHLSTVSVGYVRDFANSYLGDYYTLNRAYGSLSYFFGSAFVMDLSGGVSFVTYPPVYDRASHTIQQDPGFTQPWADVTLFGEYRGIDTLGINATLRYSSAGDHTIVQTFPNNVTITDNLKFTRYEAYLGVRWFL